MNKKQEQQIKKVAEKMNLKYLYLFGSQARGDVKPLSDFDFAVKFDGRTKNKFKAKLKLMNELTGIVKKENVDVVDMEKANPLLSFNVIKDGKILYCRNKSEQVMDKFRIMQIYFDRDYYYERHFKKTIDLMARGEYEQL